MELWHWYRRLLRGRNGRVCAIIVLCQKRQTCLLDLIRWFQHFVLRSFLFVFSSVLCLVFGTHQTFSLSPTTPSLSRLVHTFRDSSSGHTRDLLPLSQGPSYSQTGHQLKTDFGVFLHKVLQYSQDTAILSSWYFMSQFPFYQTTLKLTGLPTVPSRRSKRVQELFPCRKSSLSLSLRTTWTLSEYKNYSLCISFFHTWHSGLYTPFPSLSHLRTHLAEDS